MKAFVLIYICSAIAIQTAAQQVVFAEDFETGGMFTMSPGWISHGTAPVPVAGCDGNWGLQKACPNVGVPLDEFLFHPIPYDYLQRYSVDFLHSSAPNGGPLPSVAAYAGLGWLDTSTFTPVTNFEQALDFSYPCTQSNSFLTPIGQSSAPNVVFGVLISAQTDGSGALFMDIDKVRVNTMDYKAKFNGTMLLAGPYDPNTGLMSDTLRSQGLVPLMEPYSALGWPQIAGGGGETTTAAILSSSHFGPLTGLNTKVVDWVSLELRDQNDSTVVVATKQALLLQDGSIMSASGSSDILFGVRPGVYYIALRHRNHLGAMTASTRQLPYPGGGGIWFYPFATSSIPMWGTEAMKEIGNKKMLWEGNVQPDGVLKYTGSLNDRDPILQAIGGSTPTSVLNAYINADVNLDGWVKYAGANNDRDPILQNIGGSTPSNTRIEQLP